MMNHHPGHYDPRQPDLLDAPRLVLQAVFAVLVHTRAEIERKVWAEPRAFTPPPCGPVVHEYRCYRLPRVPGDCR